MFSFVVGTCLVALASANFIPPYYGGYDDHKDNFGKYNNHHGDYYGSLAGYGNGYDGNNYDRAAGHNGYYGGDYGAQGYGDRHSQYSNGAADGYDDAHHDEGARHAADAEGMKKYSYFTSGSGPEGSYSKGYYGSEGYDHQDSKAHHAADGAGAGYKKGYYGAGDNHHDGHSNFGKAAASDYGYENEHNAAKYGYAQGKHDLSGHDNGWINQAHANAHAAHGPHF